MKIILDKELKKPKQYSKQWMSRWQAFCMIWLSAFFIADIWFNHCEHLETLCITLVTSIVGTVIGYFCKSYFETKQEKINEMTMNTEQTFNEIEGRYSDGLDNQ